MKSDHIKPILLSVNGACRALSVGRTTLYALMGNGRLPRLKIGNATRIPAAAVQKLVDELTREQAA